MLKLFAEINAKTWWRSLQGVEMAAMVFYSIFILLLAGQFMGVFIVLLFTDDITFAQQFYPWITEEIRYFVHLVFLNSLLLSQIFFTRINRLNINENRKLLAYGFTVNRLSAYLNVAGFFHPINLLFTVFWVIYAISSAYTALQAVVSILMIIATYGVIHSLKWRFRIFSAEKFKQVGAVVVTLVLFSLLIMVHFDYQALLEAPQQAADALAGWMILTPGYLFYHIFAEQTNAFILSFFGLLFLFLIGVSVKDMILNSKQALLTPPQQSSNAVKSGQLSIFMRWLGPEGGKYFYSVWNHKYSKVQLLITYVLVIPYIVLLGDGVYIIGVFLTLIPIIFLLVMLTNMFGFENRELLKSLQLPIPVEKLVKERFTTALLVTLSGSSIVLILVPVFIREIPIMIQVHLGIIMICMVFLHYILKSSVENYKKIEEVSVMSVSNPVLPASVTFSSVFIVMILGVFTFIVIESFIWYHIAILLAVNAGLFISLRKKLKTIYTPFKEKVIPKLWNEL